MDLTYYLVAADPQERRWLTLAVNVGGSAMVIGRWSTEEAADADVARWFEFEGSARA